MDGTNFKIFTDVLKAYEQKDESGIRTKRLRTTASSSVRDLAGDEILPVAIHRMADQARENMTIFLNHSYNVPEDVLGSVADAQVVQRGVDENSNPIIDLDLDIELNEANPRAVQAWTAIDNGTKLGCSVGAKVRHATKHKGGGLVIDDIDLLEASIVGIPANQRSWVHYAVKSISALSDSDSVVEDETVVEEEEDAEDESVTLSSDVEVGSILVDNTTNTFTTTTTTATNGDTFTWKTVPDELAPETPEPDKEAARTRVTVTVDSDAQEAPSRSNPGNAKEQVADETATGDDEALGDSVTRAVDISPDKIVQESLEARLNLVDEVITLRRTVTDVTRERDEALANLAFAKALLEKVGDLPLARKAKPTAEMLASVATKRWDNIYDEEVVKLLGRK